MVRAAAAGVLRRAGRSAFPRRRAGPAWRVRDARARLCGRRPHRWILRAAYQFMGCAGRAVAGRGGRGLGERLPGRRRPAAWQRRHRLYARAARCDCRSHDCPAVDGARATRWTRRKQQIRAWEGSDGRENPALGFSRRAGACLRCAHCPRACPRFARRLLRRERGLVPRRGHDIRARDRHQGRDEPQELGRDLRAAQGRGVEPARRYLVGRHRRPAYAGRRRRTDHRIQIAEARRAAGLGRAPMGAIEGPHSRDLFGRARLRLQYGPRQEARDRGTEVLGRPARRQAEGRGASRRPEFVRHVVHAACDRRSADGRGEGLHLPQGTAQEHQPVHQVRRGSGESNRIGRDDHRHRVPARSRLDGGRQGADQGGDTVRRDRLRNRLDVDRQRRAQPRQRKEMVRLGADRTGAGTRRADQELSGAGQQDPPRCRRRRQS